MTKQYLVTWAIDVEADNAQEAAAQALIIMRDPDPANTALVFDVVGREHGDMAETIDLDPDSPLNQPAGD